MLWTVLWVPLMKARFPFWLYSTFHPHSIHWTTAISLHACMACLAYLAKLLIGFHHICLIDSSLSVSMVGPFHKRIFIMGFLRVLSWAQYSLLCIHSHCLTSFLKDSAITTNLLTTLNFTNYQLHLTFIHWFTTSSCVLILLGVGWLAIDWSQTMIKLKLLWLDLVGGSVCHKIAIWELAVRIFLSKVSKASGFTMTLPCLWQSILTTIVVQRILRSEELALFAIS